LVQKQAQIYQHSFNYEFCFLFIHGMLHLLGYDHEMPKEKKIMFDLQDLIYRQLGLKD
jgi:probable rRNA maturation factor